MRQGAGQSYSVRGIFHHDHLQILLMLEDQTAAREKTHGSPMPDPCFQEPSLWINKNRTSEEAGFYL